MKLKAESLRENLPQRMQRRSEVRNPASYRRGQEKESSKESIAGEIAQRQKEWDEAERMLFSWVFR